MTAMDPKIVGNPLVAWRDDSVLQVGWGSHSVIVDPAPRGLPSWLGLMNGKRSRASLLEAAERLDILVDQAVGVLDRLLAAGILTEQQAPGRVRLHACGLLAAPLSELLTWSGMHVDDASDVVVFGQGQVPSMLGAPALYRRLIPIWFETRAVHVGPVLDAARGPCPQCIDRTWAATDPGWGTVVAQAASVPTWSEPAQLVQAAAAISMVAEDPRTVGLEMIFDPTAPGPMWRVWTANAGCHCVVVPAAATPALEDKGRRVR
jgi:hypothetical protein